ncbi:hypothetical protein ABPG75_005009 [Micractinium tetrahymenae]
MPVRMDPAVSWVADTLDYEPLYPAAAARAAALRPPPHESGLTRRLGYCRTLVKLASTVLAAAAAGATAAAMQASIDWLVGWRNAMLQRFFAASLLQAYAAQLVISCCLVLAAAGAVQALAPRAAGGGVTWVMAVLNGNAVGGLFTPLVFAVKWCGSVAALGASLCLGVEAPMVHLGACLASMACRADQRLWALLGRQGWLHRLLAGRRKGAEPPGDAASLALAAAGWQHENREEREAVSAGAAAGIAAAFGAPIGGVLFSLEEACTVWSRRIAWRCFLASTIAVITHSQLNRHADSGLLSAQLRPLAPLEWAQQSPLILAVSAGGGLLGAAFNRLRLAARPLRARAKHHAGRVREAMLVAAATVTTIAALSATVGSCLPVPAEWRQDAWVQHTCPAGHYNDLATAWLSPPVWSIRTLISLGTEEEPLGKAPYYTPASLAAMAAAYLPLFAASAALAVPGGLFMPSLLLGGAAGALAGGALRAALPGWRIQPGLYALCSATAVLGGVFRSSISLVVLMTEATGTLAPMLGVILAVITANACAVLLGTEGVYESELEAEIRLNYLPQDPPPKFAPLVAEQLMASPVEGLPRVVPVAQARELLRFSKHHGFPVFDPLHRDGRAGTFRADGFIVRSQLEMLLAAPQAYCDAHGRYLLAPPDVDAFEEELAAAMAYRLAHVASEGQLAALGSPAGAANSGAADASPLRQALLATRRSRHDGGLGAAGARPAPAPPSPFEQPVLPHLNLGPFMDTAPMAVRLDTPAPRVHSLFVSLSLRHLLVVDEANHAHGMITRRDLAHAAGSLLRARSIAQQSAVFLDSDMERPLESG